MQNGKDFQIFNDLILNWNENISAKNVSIMIPYGLNSESEQYVSELYAIPSIAIIVEKG